MMIHRYGPDPLQFGELSLPAAGATSPVVVLIHGGFWRDPYRLDLMYPLAVHLLGLGYAVWNIEYRCGGDSGGGYPGTLHDVGQAIDLLAVLAKTTALDLSNVAVVGHSAGGHLALWSASRHLLRASDVGSRPAVRPAMAVSQAGVVDLTDAARQNLGNGATQEFLGASPREDPEAYRVAQPVLDASVVRLVHGTEDDRVPLSQSVDAATASGAKVAVINGADHFDVIDPEHQSWAVVVDWLQELRADG